MDEINKIAKELDKEVDRIKDSVNLGLWILNHNQDKYKCEIKCEFCHDTKNVDYMDIVNRKVPWFESAQMLQPLLDAPLLFVCEKCSVKLSKVFIEETRKHVNNLRMNKEDLSLYTKDGKITTELFGKPSK